MDPDGDPGIPIRSSFANDAEMVDLIEYFVSELPERMSAINSLWKCRQLDDLRRLAHQLKGASGGYGFEPVGEAAARLEQALQMSAEVEQLQEQVDDLLDVCRRATH